MKSLIMRVYDFIRAHDWLPDREYYTYKMRRHVKDNAGWWILGFAIAGGITLFALTDSILWLVGGGLVTAIVVWLLLHLGHYA